MLWGGTPDGRATSSLRSALWRLNGFQTGLLAVRDSTVTVAPHVVIDVHEVEGSPLPNLAWNSFNSVSSSILNFSGAAATRSHSVSSASK